MAASSWAMACVWLSLGQAPSDVLVTNQRSVSIPVNIQDARRAELRELVLYASTDQGRTWQQVAAIMPTQSAFTFTAPIDGTYWLQVASINKQNQQEPDNLYKVPPESYQKMVIDTMKPLLRLGSPQRQGDEIALSWELQEDNPDWNSFRLEYQAKDAGTLVWTPIQATAGLTGQARFRPGTTATVALRLSFTDKAGNQAFTMVDVLGTGTVAPTGFNNPPPAGATAAPAPMFPGAPAPLATPPSIAPNLPAANVPTPNVAVPNVPMPNVGAQNLLPTPAAPLVAPEATKVAVPLVEAPRTFPMNPPPARSDAGRVVASTDAALSPTQAPGVAPAVKKPLPPLQYVNNPEVTLEYELARVGPSGIGSIELWWTRDDGLSWELYAIDPEGKNGTVSNGRHKRTVELQHGDGIYGFVLVVKSKAGLGKAPPRAGDAPEIRVELDTLAPRADLIQPTPVPGRSNTLELKWSARDANLNGAPILLEWAAKRDGPWQPIAPPLANTGKHTWQLPDGLPVQVYLRLRARDLAGNESVAVTADPQLVDLSEPEGRLLNVTVSPR